MEEEVASSPGSFREEGDHPKPVASTRSLLNWLSTFDVPDAKCTKLEELSSGHVLLKCLKTVMPEAACAGDESSCSETGPWDELWRIMEEFCQCSLEKSISIKEVLSGNQEHISRVVVMLLCITAYSKDNGQVIEKIKSLDDSDQRDIMFYIQKTLASINSNAIASGEMTSGVNEVLPDLEDYTSPSSLSQPSSPAAGAATPVSSYCSLKLTYSTPHDALSKAHHLLKPADVLSHFDTPVGNKNLISPAVFNLRPLARPHPTSPTIFSSPVTRPTPFKLSTEVPRLRHRITVLEGLVGTHQKNAQDYYSELCAKSEAYEALLTEKNQLEEKLSHLQELRDTQDELDQANLNLSKMEKNLERLRLENESLCGYRDQVTVLEAKLTDYDLTHSKLHEYKEKVDKMSLALLEKTSALNEMSVAHQTIQAQLHGKSSEMENLLQQNRESSWEIKELVQKCKGLEEDKVEMQSSLDKKTESERSLASKMDELQTQLKEVQSESAVVQREKETLAEQLQSVEADYTSYRTHMEGTLQDVQRENESLKVKCSVKEGELESEAVEKQSLSEKLVLLENERQQLQEVLKQLQKDTEDKIFSLTNEKEHLTSNLAAKESSLVQHTSEKVEVEKELASLTHAFEAKVSELASKDAVLSSLSTEKSNLAKDLMQLRSDLAQTLERCEAKESALSDCQAELAEKDDLVIALSSEKVELLGQLDTLRTDIDGMNAKHNTLVQDIDDLRQENSSIVRELDVIISKNAAEEKHRSQLQESNEDLASKLEKLHQQLKEEQLSNAQKDTTVSSLSADKSDLEQQVARLQADYDSLLKEIEAAREDFASQLAVKNERATALEGENASLVHQVKELECQKEIMETRVSGLETTLLDKESELNLLMSSVKTDLGEKISELQQKLDAKEAEVEQYSSSLDSYKNQLSSVEVLVTSLESEKRALEEEKNRLERDYQNKSEADRAKVEKCHELVAEFKTTVEQMKDSLEERNQENIRLMSSLAQSEKQIVVTREKNEVVMKQFEEERTRMEEEILQLEQRLKKQQRESQDQYQQISSELELSQQKYTSELNQLNEQNKTLLAQQSQVYSQLREENIETLRKQSKLYEEIDKLREREQEATSLCREYEVALEKERGCVLSATKEIKQLKDELQCYEGEKLDEIGQLQQELDQVKYEFTKKQRKAMSEKNSLMAQLSYASEKIKYLEKSKNFSPPPSRRGSVMLRREPPVGGMSTASTISGFSVDVQDMLSDADLESRTQHEFDHLSTNSSQSVIHRDSPQDEDNMLLLRSSTSSLANSEKRFTLGDVPPLCSDNTTISSWSTKTVKDGKRISELQRRNAKALPHLKSSYPIETQTQRESPSVCDESIKNGSRHFEKSKQSDMLASQPSSKEPVAFEVTLQPDPLLSSTINSEERKRAREKESFNGAIRSPAPKSLRLVSGQSPTEALPRSKMFTKGACQLSRMTAGMKLRDYLDKHEPQVNDPSKQGTSFVVSPPKRKGQGQLPKRLQENLSRRQSAAKRQSHIRRETIVKRKPAVTATASRNALKNKN